MNLKLPKFLYAPLPYLYMGTGALVIFEFRGWIGGITGALLIVAGATVWMLRKDFRDQERSDGPSSRYDESRFGETKPAPLASPDKKKSRPPK